MGKDNGQSSDTAPEERDAAVKCAKALGMSTQAMRCLQIAQTPLKEATRSFECNMKADPIHHDDLADDDDHVRHRVPELPPFPGCELLCLATRTQKDRRYKVQAIGQRSAYRLPLPAAMSRGSGSQHLRDTPHRDHDGGPPPPPSPAPACSDETGFPGHQDNEGQACSDDKGDQDPPSPIPPVPLQRPQDKDATTSQGTASFLRWAATPLRILSLDLPRILSPSGAYSFLLVLVGC